MSKFEFLLVVLGFIFCFIGEKIFLGNKKMRTLLFIGAIVFVWYYWTPITNMVKGNWPIADKAITQWFIDHTPKQ